MSNVRPLTRPDPTTPKGQPGRPSYVVYSIIIITVMVYIYGVYIYIYDPPHTHGWLPS